MERFIVQENIRRFRERLAKERDPERRLTIERLLEAERAKLTDFGVAASDEPPQPDLRKGEETP